MCFHAVTDFNDTVIETEIPGGQTQVLQEIQIFDDDINEAPEVFYVSLDILSEQRSNVMLRVQRTTCRIRQSDRKLSSQKFHAYDVVHFSVQNCYFVKCLVPSLQQLSILSLSCSSIVTCCCTLTVCILSSYHHHSTNA